MFPQYSLCPHIKVYDTTVQIMFLECSLCPSVQFMS